MKSEFDWISQADSRLDGELSENEKAERDSATEKSDRAKAAAKEQSDRVKSRHEAAFDLAAFVRSMRDEFPVVDDPTPDSSEGDPRIIPPVGLKNPKTNFSKEELRLIDHTLKGLAKRWRLVRKLYGYSAKGRKNTANLTAKVLELRNIPVSKAEIARQLGISRNTVHAIIRRAKSK
jgi:DNA invertase Pin-like site-specific DNA recombinase